jgi:alpha-tubulin suppressor-like RCC1 family protein
MPQGGALVSRSRVWVVAALAAAACLMPTSGASAAVDSQVYTWGSNSFGQLGDGSSTSTVRGTPDLASVSNVVDVSGGREHVIALTDSGAVYTWGSDAYGQLGDGPTLANKTSPVLVSGLSDVTDVDDGHYHSLALKADGTVWGWGQNSLGQLAQGNETVREPTPVQWGTITNAVGIYGGRDMTYVLTSDGTVWCAGGQGLECGRANQASKITSPVSVNGLPDVEEIAGGRNHAVALASDGTVWTWGVNDYGQLGDGTKSDRATPHQVAGLSNIVDVGAGAEHSLAVAADGHVFSWGRNYRGELGLGNTTDKLVPTQVPGLSGIAEVDAGRSHSFAIGFDGRLWVWGWNEGHQVNTSSAASVLNPYQVPGLTDVVAAGGGQAYSVALTRPIDAVLADGFDNGLAGWTVTGKLRLDTSRSSPVGDVPSVRAALRDRKGGAVRSLPQETSAACARVWVRPVSAAKTTTLLALREGSGANVALLNVSPSGSLIVRSTVAGMAATTGATLASGKWQQIQLCSHHDQGASDSVSVSVGGVEVGTWSWATSTIGQVQIGSTKKTTATFNLDDVAVF